MPKVHKVYYVCQRGINVQTIEQRKDGLLKIVQCLNEFFAQQCASST
jgi:hypothetical protein